jgi:hypothetical protein
MSAYRCSIAGLVDLHFTARITPADEIKMRRHLGKCQACRARYDRWLVLAEIDHTVPSRTHRLAVGLGLIPPHLNWRAPAYPLLLAATLGSLGLVLTDGRFHTKTRPSEAAADRAASVDGAEFAVFGAGHDGSDPAILHPHAEIAPDQPLGFAYANAADSKHMMIFGVGEHRHVVWYQPDPVDQRANPAAPPVVHGELVHELSEKITHTLDEGELQLFAVFTNRDDLRVSEVEAAVASAPSDRTLGLYGCELRSVPLRVRRSTQ